MSPFELRRWATGEASTVGSKGLSATRTMGAEQPTAWAIPSPISLHRAWREQKIWSVDALGNAFAHGPVDQRHISYTRLVIAR